MRNALALLATAVAFAVLATLLWRALGEDAFTALGLLMTVALAVDNIRLRRQLKASIRPPEKI